MKNNNTIVKTIKKDIFLFAIEFLKDERVQKIGLQMDETKFIQFYELINTHTRKFKAEKKEQPKPTFDEAEYNRQLNAIRMRS